jgi:hypothetical protein
VEAPKTGERNLAAAPLGWTVFAALGLVVAVAALVSPGQPPTGGGTAVRLIARLPDALVAIVVSLFALAVLLLFLLLLPRGVRRRRKEEDEFEPYYEPPKASPWVILALLALLLVPVAAVTYALWIGWSPMGRGAVQNLGELGPPPRPLPGTSEMPGVSHPLFTVTVAIWASAAGLAALGLMLWIYLGDRLAWWWAGSFPGEASDRLVGAVEESLDDLWREPDARVAIIKCYRRFERVLAAARLARAPWQTPIEFMREALGRLPLPEDSVERITRLFEIARFSHHRLEAAQRDAACAALIEIKAVLERRSSSVPSA